MSCHKDLNSSVMIDGQDQDQNLLLDLLTPSILEKLNESLATIGGSIVF